MPDALLATAPSSTLPVALAAPAATATADPFAALLATLTPAAATAPETALPIILPTVPQAAAATAPLTPALPTPKTPAATTKQNDSATQDSDDSDTDKTDSLVNPSPDAEAVAPAIVALLALTTPLLPPRAAKPTSESVAASPQGSQPIAPKAVVAATPSTDSPSERPAQGPAPTDRQTAAWQTVKALAADASESQTSPLQAATPAPRSAAASPSPDAPMDVASGIAAGVPVAAPLPARTGTSVRQRDTTARVDPSAKAGEKDASAPNASPCPLHGSQDQAVLSRFDSKAPAVLAKTDTGATTDTADASITRTLSVAQDGQWLDSLAKDIASTSSSSTLQFRLDPLHLGTLAVRIEHGSDGATVHLSSSNAETRQMLVDAQPRLAAEARAQGLTLKDASVGAHLSDQRSSSHNGATSDGSLGGQSAGQGSDDRRNATPALTTAHTQDTAPAPVTVIDDTARYA